MVLHIDSSDVDPLDLKKKGEKAVSCIAGMLVERCGPASKGYDNCKAKTTGNVLLASVGHWYQSKGVTFPDSLIGLEKGVEFVGTPWRTKRVLNLKELMAKEQAQHRTRIDNKAYQLKHDDVATVLRQ